MKYGTWKIAAPPLPSVRQMCAAGYSPLAAYVLCARGYDTPEKAAKLLDVHTPLLDPFYMRDMSLAVDTIRTALSSGVKIAVFGDYDVDGITATCLLTDYLRSCGASCVTHIPGRLEEGYGLNESAIRTLYAEGVRLLISVDCGITALAEAELCKQLGMTLVVTDHHECKDTLPDAAAVIDPHRPDATYPHKDLSGVGVAFKLAAALDGDQTALAERYCDLICLGTVADVMPLRGENRRLVVMGLRALQDPRRLGLRALMEACGCGTQNVTASTIGYVLAPRINAAGRMEHAELAAQLFLTHDPAEAADLAETLCHLNRERQKTEYEIYREASARLRAMQDPGSAIVLAGENWHQGVVGVVASRLCEEYCRPTFLICLNGDHGKASSRSYGGFNLFASLSELSELLEGYGGHELAAGFTIRRDNIDEFRRRICDSVARFADSGQACNALEIDCEAPPELITEENVQGLSALEPCGVACPKPIFCLSEAKIRRVSAIGNGKHLRLTLSARNGASLQAVYFSGGELATTLHSGDLVDVAFHLQINEYRGERSVQLSLIDLHRSSPSAIFDRFSAGQEITAAERAAIAPERRDIIDVWQYLHSRIPDGRPLSCELKTLSNAIAQQSSRHSLQKTLPCLAILQELQFLTFRRNADHVEIRMRTAYIKNPLENSRLYHSLRGDINGNLCGSL